MDRFCYEWWLNYGNTEIDKIIFNRTWDFSPCRTFRQKQEVNILSLSSELFCLLLNRRRTHFPSIMCHHFVETYLVGRGFRPCLKLIYIYLYCKISIISGKIMCILRKFHTQTDLEPLKPTSRYTPVLLSFSKDNGRNVLLKTKFSQHISWLYCWLIVQAKIQTALKLVWLQVKEKLKKNSWFFLWYT